MRSKKKWRNGLLTNTYSLSLRGHFAADKRIVRYRGQVFLNRINNLKKRKREGDKDRKAEIKNV